MRQSHDHLQQREINETLNVKHISIQIFSSCVTLHLVIKRTFTKQINIRRFKLIFPFNDAKCDCPILRVINVI